MAMQAAYTEALERALGSVIARATAELALLRDRADAVLAQASARLAEAETRLQQVEGRIAQMVAEQVSAVVAALPPPAPGKDADPEVVRALIAEAVAALPPPAPGRDADPEMMRAMIAESVAAMPAPAPGRDADPDVMRAMIAEAIAALPPPKDGAPGKLPIVRAWSDRVHYVGDVVSHGGATFQALVDTAREPPHADWTCLARAGTDGRSFRIRGTWQAGEDYRGLDVVALGGSSFAARRDAPGPCPGEGWQLLASHGKAGRPADRVPPSSRPVACVERLAVDDDGLLTLTNADGSTVECDLYPVLSRL